MEHFIESVRKYPCLWKVDTFDYKNNELREAAWRSITVECDLTDGLYLFILVLFIYTVFI